MGKLQRATEACNFTKTNTHPCLFSRFLNCANCTIIDVILYKVQNLTNIEGTANTIIQILLNETSGGIGSLHKPLFLSLSILNA